MGQEEEGALDSNDPLFQEIEQVFAPRDNDVIAIASAPTRQVAEHCVVAAALTLVP
jgi:phosphopantetheine adenylyltransferase